MAQFEEFLSPILHGNNYSVLPLAGDASTRRYYRIVTESKAWVLMEWEPFDNPDHFPFLSVQRYFDTHGVRVPKVFHFDQNKGLFLLEDLGDLTLERRFWEFQKQDNVLPFYKKTLDQLIRIHSLCFEDKTKKNCTAYEIEFSVEKLMWEFNYTKKHLLMDFLKLELSENQLHQLEKDFLDICETLYQSPQVICHRDFHSRNVMIRYDQVAIIDFQDARMGPPAYDLVSLFHDSYVNLQQSSIDHLMKYYVNQFPHYTALNLSGGEFQFYFDIQTIQRCFKACGSFASFKNTRNDERYLGYIPDTLQKVSEVISRYPKYNHFLNIVEMAKEKWETQ